MTFPPRMAAALGAYLTRNWVSGRNRFPMVLMLEPTERCNLNCIGCGRVREYSGQLQSLTVDECLQAVDDANAPVVSVSGGEPLLHPDIEEIVDGIIQRGAFVHFCTNGLLLESSLPKFKPGSHMSFVLHLDGLAPTHDRNVNLPGVFDKAIEGLKAAKAEGFRVYTNTTIFKHTDMDEIDRLFDLLTGLGVDGLMMSPAFHFENVDSDVFMSRDEVIEKLQPLREMRTHYDFYNTSAYLDFLLGEKDAPCMPWSTPTRTPKGWRRPCYLIADEHCDSFAELMDHTDWSKYGVGNDPRCASCMMHSGFEASLIDRARHSLPELFSLARGR
ncbi:MAG: adenosyl-hopene transferase HpnH [Chloroflexota bacterium]